MAYDSKMMRDLARLVRMDKDGKLAVADMEDVLGQRPKTRGDCLPGGSNSSRPCPWFGCKWHIGLDINPETGSIQVRELADMEQTCSLDVADRGGITLEEVAKVADLTRERIRQVEVRGLQLIRPRMVYDDVAPDDWERLEHLGKPRPSESQLASQMANGPSQIVGNASPIQRCKSVLVHDGQGSGRPWLQGGRVVQEQPGTGDHQDGGEAVLGQGIPLPVDNGVLSGPELPSASDGRVGEAPESSEILTSDEKLPD